MGSGRRRLLRGLDRGARRPARAVLRGAAVPRPALGPRRRPSCRCVTRGFAPRSPRSRRRSAGCRRTSSRARTSASIVGPGCSPARPSRPSRCSRSWRSSRRSSPSATPGAPTGGRARPSVGNSASPRSTCRRAELDEAFLLSLAAADLQDDDDASRFQASRALIGRYSRLVALLHPAEDSERWDQLPRGRHRAGRSDRRHGMVARRFGRAAVVEGRHRRTEALSVAVPAGYSPSVAFVGDTGQIVIGSTGGSVAIVDGAGVGAETRNSATGSSTSISRVGERSCRPTTERSTWSTSPTASGSPARASHRSRGRAATPHSPTLSHGRFVVASAGTHRVARLERRATSWRRSTTPPRWRRSRSARTTWRRCSAPSADGTIRTWSRDADSLVAGDAVETPDAIGRPRQLVASPDGRRVLVTGDAGSALVNLTTGAAESVELGVTGLVAIDPSGRYAAIGGAQLTVWDLMTGQRAFAVPEPANALAWSGPCDVDVAVQARHRRRVARRVGSSRWASRPPCRPDQRPGGCDLRRRVDGGHRRMGRHGGGVASWRPRSTTPDASSWPRRGH